VKHSALCGLRSTSGNVFGQSRHIALRRTANTSCPLSDFALELLRAASERAARVSCFLPSPVDSKPIRKRSATRAVTRIASDTGVLDIGTHDLRRMLATGLGEMGVADELIERVLNLAPRTVAGKHYKHAKLFEGMRTALEARSSAFVGSWRVQDRFPMYCHCGLLGSKHDPAPRQSDPIVGALLSSVCLRPGPPLTI
jgi:integrase